jgi:hypothetical protein
LMKERKRKKRKRNVGVAGQPGHGIFTHTPRDMPLQRDGNDKAKRCYPVVVVAVPSYSVNALPPCLPLPPSSNSAPSHHTQHSPPPV